MINHFRTWLLNRPADFFSDSIFPVHTDTDFKPSPQEDWSLQIDRILFGLDPDASLVDYRFFQFLRVIDGCFLRDHVRRFDARETYRPDRYEVYRDDFFESSVTPMQGLTVTEDAVDRPEFLRRTFTILHQSERMIVLDKDGQANSVTPISNDKVRMDSLGLTVTASRPGSWRVDYRKRPIRSIYDIVRDIHDLPVTALRSLFEAAGKIAPEYGEGYRTITDSLSRFCMVLFAQAIANERMQQRWDMGAKRVERESSDLPGDAEGSFYYGHHVGEVLRLADIKNELRCSNGVRGRQQTFEFSVPRMAYIYLIWPVRFGLPVRNRIVVDGFLNSAWNISYLTDLEEQYVVFRSEYKIRTDMPVRIEIP